MTKQDAHKIAKKLGFEQRAGKELFYTFRYEGQLIATTAIPKGKGELHVENDFRQQLMVTREQLALARKCPFGARQYLQRLAELGLIEYEPQ